MSKITIETPAGTITITAQAPGAFNWAQILALVTALLQLLFPVVPPAFGQGGAAGQEDNAEAALYSQLVALQHACAVMSPPAPPAPKP